MPLFITGKRALLSVAIVAAAVAACAAWLHPERWNAWPSGWGPRAVANAPSDELASGGQADDDEHEVRRETVRLASADLARRIGIETAPAVLERHRRRLACNAETAFDARRSAEVLARVDGVIGDVRVELSQVVRRGEVLAVMDSAAVGGAKTQYRTALANLDLAQSTWERIRKLAEKEILAGKSELEAVTALTTAKNNLLEAEQRLRNLGFQTDELTAIAAAKSPDNLLEVLAPIDGHVIAWDATIGEVVAPGAQLFALADTRKMWLWIDVYESDIDSIEVGQPVAFTISGTERPTFDGKITAIGAEVDRVTRTTRVRAELANPEGRLRANQFGRAKIEVTPEHEALVVPADAVQRDADNRDVVFLPEGESVYHARAVVVRPTDDAEKVEIVRGLQASDRVVTTGAFLLLSELYKDRIAEDVD